MKFTKPYTSICLFIIGILLFTSLSLAQSQPVFRIGVLDNERGPISNGARLAVQRLNDAGGVRGADGSFFRLELVIQPTNFGVNLEEAVNNLNQANIIAALGPETDSEVLNGLPLLQSLNVPVLVPAQNDTIIISDSSAQIFRSRSAQILSGQALASYLLQDIGATAITAVQLDIESTDKVVGFVSAAGALGINPERLILQGDTDELVNAVIASDPEVLVAYGSPALAAEFYNGLRNGGWTGRFAYDQVTDPTFQDAVPFIQLSGTLSTVTWPFTAVDAMSSDFLTSYIRAYGEVPGEVEAASYDSVILLAEAIGLPGDLVSNLSQLDEVVGVQGRLNPARLARGETSNNVAVVRLGPLGAPQVLGRYAGGVRLPDDTPPTNGTAAPQATPTPQGVVVTIESARQNIRTGPSTAYDVIAQAQEGDQFQVVGATADNQWVVIDYRGRQGWLFVNILEVFGDLNSVPIIDPPPTPTPGFTPTPAPPQEADIVIDSAVAVPSPIIPNQPFTVSVVVRNAGNTDAGPFAIAATFPPNNTYASTIIPGLARGQVTTANLSATLNNSGTYTVTIVADLNNEVPEGPGENNNFFNFTYTVNQQILNQGTRTLNPGDTLDLEGNAVQGDINWDGNTINALFGAQLGVISNIPYEQIHRDLITPTIVNQTSVSRSQLNANFSVGIFTADGNRGVIRIDDIPGNQLVVTFKVYSN